MTPIVTRTQTEIDAGTWSLSARIADALATAIVRFGPRDTSFHVSGYEFRSNPGPFLNVMGNPRSVEILLPDYCQGDFNQGVYQAAHETLHMLAPAGCGRPTNLEEGLATMFSEDYALAAVGCTYLSPIQSYAVACARVRQYVTDDAVIRAVRAEQPTFSLVTPALLRKYQPLCTPELADYLCASFQA